MQKKGFTLVELLAVIVILTLMGIIVIPIIESSINNGKDDLYIAQIDTLKSSFKKYALKELNSSLLYSNDDLYISLYQLKIAGAVALDLKDPRDEKMLPDDMLFRIQKNNKSFTYEVLENRGTKTNKTSFDESTPVLKVKNVVYSCATNESSFTSILNDYEINNGTVTKEIYDSNMINKIDLNTALASFKNFRIVYKANDAYAIKNIIRSGCE